MLPLFWRFRAAALKCFGSNGLLYPGPSSFSTISLASSINSPKCSFAMLPSTIMFNFLVILPCPIESKNRFMSFGLIRVLITKWYLQECDDSSECATARQHK